MSLVGLKSLIHRFETYQQHIRLWSQNSDAYEDFLIGIQKQNFKTSGASAGGRGSWRGYQAESKYKAYKHALVKAGRIRSMKVLRMEGSPQEKLYPSLTSKTHYAHVFRAHSDSVEFGTALPWARRLHDGGTNQFGERAPARPFLLMSRKQRKEASKLVASHIFMGKT